MEREGTFTEFMPKIEIEGGNVVLHVGKKQHVVLVPIPIFERFLDEGQRLVYQWYASLTKPVQIGLNEKRKRGKRRKH